MPSAVLPPIQTSVAVTGFAEPNPVLAAERERERLADQLHSGLMQSLVVIRHALGRTAGADSASDRDALPTADEAVASCLADTRRLVWHLRSRTLESSLDHALGELAHRLSSDGGACLVADTDGVVTVSPAQAALIYRVVQSAALVTAPGAVVAATVVADRGTASVTLIGTSAHAAEDADVAEWLARATSYGVSVELVST